MRNCTLLLALLSCSLWGMEEDKEKNEFLEYYNEFYDAIQEEAPDFEEMLKRAEKEEFFNDLYALPNGLKPLKVPWKEKYSDVERQMKKNEIKKSDCFQCDHWTSPDCDVQNGVIRRSKNALIFRNLNAVKAGLHSVASFPNHVKFLSELSREQRVGFFKDVVNFIKRKRDAIPDDGFEFYFNMGHRCTGASAPDHGHGQINFEYIGNMDPRGMQVTEDLIRYEMKPEFISELRKDLWSKKVYEPYRPYIKIMKLFAKKIKRDTFWQEMGKSSLVAACGHCKDEAKYKEVFIAETKNFYVVCNPSATEPGQLFVSHKDHQKRLTDFSDVECEEYTELLCSCMQVENDLVKPHGFSFYVGQGCKEPFGHKFVANIAPRFDNGTNTVTINTGLKLNPKDMKKLQENMKSEFDKSSKL